MPTVLQLTKELSPLIADCATSKLIFATCLTPTCSKIRQIGQLPRNAAERRQKVIHIACLRNAHQVSRPEELTLPYNLKAREKSSLRSATNNRLAKCEAALASA
jgi:hypothetical protein